MASGPSPQAAKDALDMWLGNGATIRLWTVAPDFDGAGGVETVPAGGAPVASFQPAVDGTGAQIASATTSVPPVFPGVPVASTDVVAISFHDPTDDHLIVLDASFSAPGSGWSAGESPTFPVTVPFVPVA